MTDAEKSVDALLATAASHLLKAGELTHQMRALRRDGQARRYSLMAILVAQELAISNHCFDEANAILLGRTEMPATAAQMGGMVN